MPLANYTFKTLADALGNVVSVKTLKRMRKKGRLKVRKLGHRKVIIPAMNAKRFAQNYGIQLAD